MEIACLLPLKEDVGKTLFPAVLLFTAFARMVRPVHHNASGATEWVGSFEQVFMEIACQDQDVRPDTTHQELAPTQMLSLAASLTPFSDYNQSPRNMYQCQMMKQTAGLVHVCTSMTRSSIVSNPAYQSVKCRISAPWH